MHSPLRARYLEESASLGLGWFVDGPVLQVLGEFVPGVAVGQLSRGGRMLRWAEAGSGSPVVIMDAALGEPGTMAWAAVMPRIARQGRVMAYDRAGLGLSDPADPLTLDTSVGDLAALAAHAGSGCILVGHSWSGLLAQLVALRTPELVAGLVHRHLHLNAGWRKKTCARPGDERLIRAAARGRRRFRRRFLGVGCHSVDER